MTDIEKVNQIKERILSLIRVKGPSLPIPIARAINISPLFTSAFLSELFSEKKIFMSNMKVGSSSVYFIPGQESQIENFIEHLNIREREAVLLLKSRKLLEDEALTPVTRVALRSTKDFAIPIRIKIDGETRLFWKYFLIQDSEIGSLIQESLVKNQPLQLDTNKSTKEEKQEQKREEKQIIKPIETKKEAIPENKMQDINIDVKEVKEIKTIKEGNTKEIIKELREDIKTTENNEIEETAQIDKPKQEPLETKKKPKKQTDKNKESDFTKKVKTYLLAKDIEILEIKEEKKKDFSAKVRIDEKFGKQEYFLIVKDKKKVNEFDLALALQKAQQERMPSLIMAPGDLDKKAQEEIVLWKNIVKFHKIKF